MDDPLIVGCLQGIGNLRDENADLREQLQAIEQLLRNGSGGQPSVSPAP